MKLEVIESKNNPLIKEVKKLKDKKYREEKSLFTVEGFRFIKEAIKSTFIIEYMFFSEEFLERQESEELLSKINKKTKIYRVSKELFKSLCSTETPQGILAVVRNKNLKVKNKHGFYVLVDKVQDPGNLGTIIRTSHASGALGVILTRGTVDLYNEKTLRSTMGSIFKVPIIKDNNLNFTKELKASGFKLISSSLDTKTNFYSLNLRENVIIAIGNEGNGISDEVYELSDLKVKLPMPGESESLNVSVAAGIMIYEIVRQNAFEKF